MEHGIGNCFVGHIEGFCQLSPNQDAEVLVHKWQSVGAKARFERETRRLYVTCPLPGFMMLLRDVADAPLHAQHIY